MHTLSTSQQNYYDLVRQLREELSSKSTAKDTIREVEQAAPQTTEAVRKGTETLKQKSGEMVEGKERICKN